MKRTHLHYLRSISISISFSTLQLVFPRDRSRAAASVQSLVDQCGGGHKHDGAPSEQRRAIEAAEDSAIARKERSAFVDYVFDTEIRKLKLEAAYISSDTTEKIKTKLVSFHVQFNRKWKLQQRSAARFKKHEAGFLKGDITEPIVCVEAVRTPADPSKGKRQPGRPSTAYDEAN